MGWSTEPPAADRSAIAGSHWLPWSLWPTTSPRDRSPRCLASLPNLDRRAVEQHAPVADGVTLATLHTAKGLEWDAVFCAGDA